MTEEFIQIDSKKTPLKEYLIWDILHEFAEATGLSIDAHYTEFDIVYASPEVPKGFYNRLILLCADVLRKGLARVASHFLTGDGDTVHAAQSHTADRAALLAENTTKYSHNVYYSLVPPGP